MAKEMVGLAGIGVGPRVAVPAGSVIVKVKGLKQGNVLVYYSIREETRIREVQIEASEGEPAFLLRIPGAVEWVQFECVAATGTPICIVRVD